MKITRYAMMLAAATGLLSACQKLDEVKAYDPDKVVAPVLHALPGEIVITPDNMGSTQTFTWDAADFGVRTQINYSIEASYNDGAKLVLFTGMNGTSSEQTYESLNNILALSVEDGGLGVPSGEPTDVDFYISATIGTDFEKFYSAPATVRMTVTTATIRRWKPRLISMAPASIKGRMQPPPAPKSAFCSLLRHRARPTAHLRAAASSFHGIRSTPIYWRFFSRAWG